MKTSIKAIAIVSLFAVSLVTLVGFMAALEYCVEAFANHFYIELGYARLTVWSSIVITSIPVVVLYKKRMFNAMNVYSFLATLAVAPLWLPAISQATGMSAFYAVIVYVLINTLVLYTNHRQLNIKF